MKLPRWLVVSLLTVSVLAVLGAGAWWWVTWPERTAIAYVERRARMATEREQHERSLPPGAAKGLPVFFPKHWRDVSPQSRTVLDLVIGRERFITFGGKGAYFVVERGRVDLWPEETVLVEKLWDPSNGPLLKFTD
jgi:hypothetical protein